MRANPAEYELIAPGSLGAVVSLLSEQPNQWLPIAGGTDLMVQYAAGKLAARKLVSLWNLPELRSILVGDGEIVIGACCTYTDLLEHQIVRREFPLLATAARWTGGVANQNRGTLGGNIVNASPAGDSLPALLAYEAELLLVSVRGERRVPYVDFHTGYKKTLLAPDELIRAVCLPRHFSSYIPYTRKVGARNAQAISKVCVAALGRVVEGVIQDVRIAAGSVAATPLRLRATEAAVRGRTVDASVIATARQSAMREIRPIDDIRSIAAYRSAVLGNLVEEFLEQFAAWRDRGLERWNNLSPSMAEKELLACCGSTAWAMQLVNQRPIHDESSLMEASDEVWNRLDAKDWLEAFSKHPRIGEGSAPAGAAEQSKAWSAQEQRSVADAQQSVLQELAAANREYEERFGRVFIVCATGKSAIEMLEILRQRLKNDDATELRESAEEQRKITNLRLKKWLSQ
ncbi:MAG TPA: 2-oxo-4-hydroxy-4-carboxy-5-ureidoimidazoline decarboxylase [Candidatus Sulfotelmatobacter sp.]|nr:2-oxo-4-hydroxy-4-carboxy-5-ureidoimidazoline decarboxylase [Candidatus Sulfotelmatobacter sp.]